MIAHLAKQDFELHFFFNLAKASTHTTLLVTGASIINVKQKCTKTRKLVSMTVISAHLFANLKLRKITFFFCPVFTFFHLRQKACLLVAFLYRAFSHQGMKQWWQQSAVSFTSGQHLKKILQNECKLSRNMALSC